MRSLTRARRSTVLVGALVASISTALVLGLLTAPAANALLRWTTYDAGRTAQIGAPDSQVLLDHGGQQTLAWVAEGEILARRSTPAGWGDATRVARIDSEARLAGAVDAAGVVTLAWVESRGRGTAIHSAQFIDGWGTPVDVIADARSTSVAAVGLSLAVVDGVPCIVASTGSLLDGSRQIKVHVLDGSSWTSAPTMPGITANPGTGQAFASGRYLGVTWTQDPDGQALVAFLDPTMGMWSTATVIESRMPVSSPPLLAVTADDTGTTAALVWGRFDSDGSRTWRYALVAETAVTAAVDLQSGIPNSVRPVGIWQGGTLWVAGVTASDTLSVWGRGVVPADDTLNASGVIPNTTSLAVDGDGQLLMGWLASDPGTAVELRTAQRMGQEWQGGPELLGARGGGVVSAVRPTVLWQRAVGGSGRGDVVLTSYQDVPLGDPDVQKLRVKDGPSVTVRWRPPADAAGITGYVVQVRKGKQAWRTRSSTGAGERTYTFRATEGTTYRVRVAATGAAERSSWSAVKDVTIPKKPKPPRR
jgi:hypothetical protein